MGSRRRERIQPLKAVEQYVGSRGGFGGMVLGKKRKRKEEGGGGGREEGEEEEEEAMIVSV